MVNFKKYLKYSPKTGEFTWLRSTRSKSGAGTNVGKIAGNVNVHGYRVISLFDKRYYVSRLAWFFVHGVMPVRIDHINHVRDDTKIKNLRDVTIVQTNKNKVMNKNNSSGHTGVRQEPNGRWRAVIGHQGKIISLGTFDTIEDAVFARKEGNHKYHYHRNHQ